jgi:hypothetical protein
MCVTRRSHPSLASLPQPRGSPRAPYPSPLYLCFAPCLHRARARVSPHTTPTRARGGVCVGPLPHPPSAACPPSLTPLTLWAPSLTPPSARASHLPVKDSGTNPSDGGFDGERCKMLGHALLDALAHVGPQLRAEKPSFALESDKYVLPCEDMEKVKEFLLANHVRNPTCL